MPVQDTAAPSAQNMARTFAALRAREPNDYLVKKANALLELASRAKERLSPSHRALVGRAVALVIDLKQSGVGDDDKSWLSEQYDRFFESAVKAEQEHYAAAEATWVGEQKLKLANALDEAQTAVKNAAADAPLKVANALDEVYQSVADVAAELPAKMAKSLLPLALVVGGVFIAFGYARRGRRA